MISALGMALLPAVGKRTGRVPENANGSVFLPLLLCIFPGLRYLCRTTTGDGRHEVSDRRQRFGLLAEDGSVYVDPTACISRLLSDGGIYS